MSAVNARERLRRFRSGTLRRLNWLPCVDFGFPPPPRVQKGKSPFSEALQRESERIYMRDVRGVTLNDDEDDWESKIGYEPVHPLDYYNVMTLKVFDLPAPKPEVDVNKPKSNNRFKDFFSNLKMKFSRSSNRSDSLNQAEMSSTGNGQAKEIPAVITEDKASQCKISALRPVDPTKYQDLADMLALRLSKRMWETAMKDLNDESIDVDTVKNFPPTMADNDAEKSDFKKKIDELAVGTVVDMIIDIEEEFWTETF